MGLRSLERARTNPRGSFRSCKCDCSCVDNQNSAIQEIRMRRLPEALGRQMRLNSRGLRHRLDVSTIEEPLLDIGRGRHAHLGVPRYLIKYMEILDSPVDGGAFVYAPSAGELEDAIDRKKFKIERWRVRAGQTATKVSKTAGEQADTGRLDSASERPGRKRLVNERIEGRR